MYITCFAIIKVKALNNYIFWPKNNYILDSWSWISDYLLYRCGDKGNMWCCWRKRVRNDAVDILKWHNGWEGVFPSNVESFGGERGEGGEAMQGLPWAFFFLHLWWTHWFKQRHYWCFPSFWSLPQSQQYEFVYCGPFSVHLFPT